VDCLLVFEGAATDSLISLGGIYGGRERLERGHSRVMIHARDIAQAMLYH